MYVLTSLEPGWPHTDDRDHDGDQQRKQQHECQVKPGLRGREPKQRPGAGLTG